MTSNKKNWKLAKVIKIKTIKAHYKLKDEFNKL